MIYCISRKQVRNAYYRHCYSNKGKYYLIFASLYVGEWYSAMSWLHGW